MTLRAALLSAAITLVFAANVSANADEQVLNGSFEQGSGAGAAGWTFAGGATACNNCVPAASGTRIAQFGTASVGPSAAEVSMGQVSQALLTDTPATLSFKVRYNTGPDHGSVHPRLEVRLGGSVLPLMSVSTFTLQFQRLTTPANGLSGSNTLSFQVFCSTDSGATKTCDRIDIDDVSLITGAPPAAPTITGTDPASPADQTSPKVRGTVGAGGPTGVKIYENATCTGTPAATGTVADFTGPGIGVSVPDGSTTALSASVSNLAGDSACSNSTNYFELGPIVPPAFPGTEMIGLKSKFIVGASGVLVLGKATNPPTSSTTQKLVTSVPSASARKAKKVVIGRGKTAIPTGKTRAMKLKLNRKGNQLLRKKGRLRAQLTIVARGPTGLRATIRQTVRLTAKRRRR
jgi:hypothetical protein